MGLFSSTLTSNKGQNEALCVHYTVFMCPIYNGYIRHKAWTLNAIVAPKKLGPLFLEASAFPRHCPTLERNVLLHSLMNF